MSEKNEGYVGITAPSLGIQDMSVENIILYFYKKCFLFSLIKSYLQVLS